MEGIFKSKITGLKETSIELYHKGNYKVPFSERPKKYFTEVTTDSVAFTLPSSQCRNYKLGDTLWAGVWTKDPKKNLEKMEKYIKLFEKYQHLLKSATDKQKQEFSDAAESELKEIEK